jgi:hypothetical protein
VCWLDLKNTLWELNQISSFALQRGTEAVSKGGSLWFAFLVRSLSDDKE